MRLITEVTDLAGKVVLLRSDLNVEAAHDAFKLERSLPTIQHLLAQRATVVLMSHRGRPAGQVQSELSLQFAFPFFQEKLGITPTLITPFDIAAAKRQIAEAVPGSFFVLENIRFAPGEEQNDLAFAKDLASLGDLYVNDAFAVDHHPSVSVSELPKLLPAYAGVLVADEVAHLGRVMGQAAQPLVVIIGGGGKAGEKCAVIKNLYDHTAFFLIGGVMANTFLKARGVDIGASQVDETIAAEVQQYVHDPKIVLPTDWVFNANNQIADVGAETVAAFAEKIMSAKTIIWNGPLGKFEEAQYGAGSLGVAKTIIASGAFSVVGGGETTQFLLESKLGDQFGFLSTGGGAMLAYLAGKPMPGLAALQ